LEDTLLYTINRETYFPVKGVKGGWRKLTTNEQRKGWREDEDIMGVLAIGLLFGCAHIEVRPLTKQEIANEGDPDTARSYQVFAFPLFAVLARKADGHRWLMRFDNCLLSNIDEPYIIIPHQGIGSITFNPPLRMDGI